MTALRSLATSRPERGVRLASAGRPELTIPRSTAVSAGSDAPRVATGPDLHESGETCTFTAVGETCRSAVVQPPRRSARSLASLRR